jgi:hypothetical protein
VLANAIAGMRLVGPLVPPTTHHPRAAFIGMVLVAPYVVLAAIWPGLGRMLVRWARSPPKTSAAEPEPASAGAAQAPPAAPHSPGRRARAITRGCVAALGLLMLLAGLPLAAVITQLIALEVGTWAPTALATATILIVDYGHEILKKET